MTWILITGAKGFIGRAVVRQLSTKGALAGGLGHGAIPERECEQWGLSDWINGDVNITNLQLLEGSRGKPNGIIHLAGGSSVGKSIHHPREDFSRTVESTIEVLEWVRQSCPEIPVVYASSAAVYGNLHSGPISESANLAPYSPYGSHKAMAETLCRSYAENYGLSVCIVRLFSVYGPNLHKQLIYDLCVRLSKSPDVVVLGGTGNERRDFIYVDDAAKLLCSALRWSNPQCPIVNGGTGRGVSVAEVARQCCKAWKSTTHIEFNGRSRPGDPISLVADPSSSMDREFRAIVEFETGIGQTVDAYVKEFTTP